jgi:glucose/arabinose dehydrogenase
MRPACLAAPLLVLLPVALTAEEPLPKPLVSGLTRPEGIARAPDGRLFVTEAGLAGAENSGRVLLIQDGKAIPFATGIDGLNEIVAFQEWLFVTAGSGVLRIDRKGKVSVFAGKDAFPKLPGPLGGIAVDEQGTLYVSDLGNVDSRKPGALYRIDPKGKVSLVTDKLSAPHAPTRVTMDGMSFVLVADYKSGEVRRLKLADRSSTKVADGLDGASSVAWDQYGRLFVSSEKGVFVVPRPGDKPVLLAAGFKAPAGMTADATGKSLLVVDRGGTVTALPISIPGAPVDTTPLPLETAVAFPDIKWAGWTGMNDKGQVLPFRPVILGHAGDGSNRIFVGTQQGVLHVFANDPKATKSQVFLDIQDRVAYNDNTNEEGFLGLAFHPKFKDNGEFFVFYTTKKAKLTNVVSRFRLSKDDPTKADPASEEQLLTFTKPYWNHDGGTLAFGPDGYLYIAHGDGGSANDPHDNGQNLKTLLGKVLRIDVDRRDNGKNYAIPKDNPFVGKKDAAPEIYAYGLRNIWRMAFDKKTGKLWAADVGQNLYEEIDLIEKGGNYGWNRREGLHPFGDRGSGPRPEFIEPIWEYSHEIGKSITGGAVYRGQRLPELEGDYIYGDYVSGRIWALRYDDAKKRVVANQPIKDRSIAIYSFGEDEKGEIYFLTQTNSGQSIFQFVKTGK